MMREKVPTGHQWEATQDGEIKDTHPLTDFDFQICLHITQTFPLDRHATHIARRAKLHTEFGFMTAGCVPGHDKRYYTWKESWRKNRAM